MLKLLKYFLWLVVLFALILGFDQLMLKSSLHAPGLKQTQRFYVDFRTRLLGMTGGKTDPQTVSIDAVIEKTTQTPPLSNKKSSRYLYVDNSGTLQFADNLQQVPSQYRQDAQPLAE